MNFKDIRTPLAILMCSIFIGCFTGCTNSIVAHGGGTGEITLPVGEKLVNVVWNENDDSLWYCMRPMRQGEVAEDYIFTETSAIGFFKGTYNIHEVNK
jgi:hypothetical protein